MKKILMLGGASIQVPAILEAVKNNYYVITCGYRPEDPGHAYAHEYHNVSTTDLAQVLELARKLKVDRVMAYVSDAGTPTAAYVAEQLGLPGNPYKTIQILTEKDRFKDFLGSNGFHIPESRSFRGEDIKSGDLSGLKYPLVVKPVDSSGCRGIKKINERSEFEAAASYALSFSRKKRIIVEETINKQGPEVTGDGFVVNGELVFLNLGDHHYDKQVNELLAYSTTWPSVLPESRLNQVKTEINSVIRKVGYKNGPINVDARIGLDGHVYFLEIAPRSGGNYVPQIMLHATGFNAVDAHFRVMDGKSVAGQNGESGCVANYIIYSGRKGLYSNMKLSNSLDKYLIDKQLFVQQGDQINAFSDLNQAIGVLLLSFKDQEEMLSVIHDMQNLVEIYMEDEHSLTDA